MKKFQKANRGFSKITDESLQILSSTVLQAMTDNEYFVDPSPTLEVLEEYSDAYIEKLSIARRRGSPYDTAVKNELRKELEKVLSELAFYVNKIADGNIAVLLSSGFELSKYRSSMLSPKKIEFVKLEDGRNEGQLVLNFERQRGARLYEYRVADEKDEIGEIQWTEKVYVTTTSQKNLIQPVVPGKTYYLSVRAINARGTGDWSEPRSWMAR